MMILQFVSTLAFNPGSRLVLLANILSVHIHHYLQPTSETDDHLANSLSNALSLFSMSFMHRIFYFHFSSPEDSGHQ